MDLYVPVCIDIKYDALLRYIFIKWGYIAEFFVIFSEFWIISIDQHHYVDIWIICLRAPCCGTIPPFDPVYSLP